MADTKQYGLVGKHISYSFSEKYFAEKFRKENLDNHIYSNFDLEDISEFPKLIRNHPNLKGLNVTIPYKEMVIPFLDKLSKTAEKIGAVNTIRLTKNGKLKGYNTDFYGFMEALEPMLQSHHKKALILGTGGASKAVAYALRLLGIQYSFVSRKPSDKALSYDDINAVTFEEYQIVINCTPLGTATAVATFPAIPYTFFTPNHIAFDLVYNPAETVFLKQAKHHGAMIQNGYDMLVFQAEKAWSIWDRNSI